MNADAAAAAERTPPSPPGGSDAKTTETSPPPAAPKKRHVGRNVALTLLALVLVGVAVFLVWGLSESSPTAYDDGVDYGLRERNTLAYAAVSNLGVGDPLVAMLTDDARVQYELSRSPANSTWVSDASLRIPPEDLQRAIVGAVAEAVPDIERLTVVQMDMGTQAASWSVAMADVQAFFAGTIDYATFEGRITKS